MFLLVVLIWLCGLLLCGWLLILDCFAFVWMGVLRLRRCGGLAWLLGWFVGLDYLFLGFCGFWFILLGFYLLVGLVCFVVVCRFWGEIMICFDVFGVGIRRDFGVFGCFFGFQLFVGFGIGCDVWHLWVISGCCFVFVSIWWTCWFFWF